MLNPAVRAALARHADAFRQALPFRYVVIDNFLQPDTAQALLHSFPGFDAKYALNEMGGTSIVACSNRQVRDGLSRPPIGSG